MPGAGSAEPNRKTTMMQEVKTSFLRRSGVLNAWANLITVATAPLMPQSRRPFRPPGSVSRFRQPVPSCPPGHEFPLGSHGHGADTAAPVAPFQSGGGQGKGEVEGDVDAGDDDRR